ncbi:hypothetical protein BDW59DRAFT_154434 [Aspergillus cavernicola]|uniref:Uncharacterized protein n=1 Tax=Aspergillus cavernicola TaxID=176166 RepID=A0ABR4HHY1_9EURO
MSSSMWKERAISMGIMVALRRALLSILTGLLLLSANADAASEAHRIGFPLLRDIWTSTPFASRSDHERRDPCLGGSPDVNVCPGRSGSGRPGLSGILGRRIPIRQCIR